jgi:serine/threonine protein kinase
MRMLDHPNIMKLFEVYETENSLYLVLELLEGGSFMDIIRECEKLDLNEVM